MPETTDTDGQALVDPAPSSADGQDSGSRTDYLSLRAQVTSRRPPWLWPWLAAVVVAIGIVLAATLTGGNGGAQPTTGSSVPGVGPGSRTPLVLPLTRIVPVSVTGHGNSPAVTRAAQAIKTELSAFYDAAVVNPANWSKGPPATAWDVFSPSIRDGARAASKAFTIGTTGANLQRLSVTNSFVTVRVLLDQVGRITSAQATVVIRADGDVKGAGHVQVVATATLLMANQGGHWLISGYPRATVDVTAATPPAPTPSPSATAAPTGATP